MRPLFLSSSLYYINQLLQWISKMLLTEISIHQTCQVASIPFFSLKALLHQTKTPKATPHLADHFLSVLVLCGEMQTHQV